MVRVLLILLTLFTLRANAATYYVATDGNDASAGTISEPWITWQKAFETAVAGDTVYFRGGVYYPSTFAQGNNILLINPDGSIGHNGEPGNPICYFNYPGETPILDCRNMVAPGTAPDNRYITGIALYDVHWVNWRGLTLRNVYQRVANVEPKGFLGYPVSNMNFDRMVVYNIGGAGWYMHSSINEVGAGTEPNGYGWGDGYIPYDTIRYTNCDTYQCCDSLPANDGQTPGNLSDGFKYIGAYNYGDEISSNLLYLSYEGCRAWHCADDGFDLPVGPAYIVFNNNWSFNHLYPAYGDYFEGNGLKIAGGDDSLVNPNPNKVITNSLFYSCDIGFFPMDGGLYQPYFSFDNNLIYKCDVGIQMRENIFFPELHDTLKAVYRNNIIYGTTTQDGGGRPYNLAVTRRYTESHNTWDFADSTTIGSLAFWTTATDYTVTDADFSMSPLADEAILAELTASRKSNGALPDITFSKLALDSDLVGSGIDVGMSSTPNLGIDWAWLNRNTIRRFAKSGTKFMVNSNGDVMKLNAPYTPPAAPALIIADHTIVEDYDIIPQQYIDSVKKMWVSIAGESHSLSYRTGLELLEALSATYAVSVTESGTPEAYTADNLRINRATWGDVDNATGWIYNYGEEDWYTNTTAITRTKASLQYCADNGPALTAFGFGWCWDATWTNAVGGTSDPVFYTRWGGASAGGPEGNLIWGLDDDDEALTSNSVSMRDYITATQSYIDYCTANNIDTKIIWTTGPIDNESNYAINESGYQQFLKYEYIRNHVDSLGTGYLFDFADILSYNDAGQQATTQWTDANSTLQTFPIIHSENMETLNANYHFGSNGAIKVAKAMWWMLARMAGWDGTTE